MPTKLTADVIRATEGDFLYYRRPIVIGLHPVRDSGEALITLRLQGTREPLVGRISDVYRFLAAAQAQRLSKAKKEARKNGVPWKRAKKELLRTLVPPRVKRNRFPANPEE